MSSAPSSNKKTTMRKELTQKLCNEELKQEKPLESTNEGSGVHGSAKPELGAPLDKRFI